MGRRLVANIAMRNPETGTVATFTAGSEVPDWAAERITNPDVWGDDAPDVGDGETQSVEEPPRSGRGSSLKAWVEYAESLGLDVDGMDRDEIIDLVDRSDDDLEV